MEARSGPSGAVANLDLAKMEPEDEHYVYDSLGPQSPTRAEESMEGECQHCACVGQLKVLLVKYFHTSVMLESGLCSGRRRLSAMIFLYVHASMRACVRTCSNVNM